MRKAMMIFFILLVSMPMLTHAQSSKDAVMGMKILQAKCQAGIFYRDYGNALGEAKYPLNLFFESIDAKKYPDLSTSLRKAMMHYENAADAWKYKISIGDIPVNSEFGKNIQKSYPNAIKDTKAGGANLSEYNIYIIESLLSLIWNEASKELDITTKLYANLEEKLSDETAKLKEEISELKREVARLKKENDLLKTPKKGKKGR